MGCCAVKEGSSTGAPSRRHASRNMLLDNAPLPPTPTHSRDLDGHDGFEHALAAGPHSLQHSNISPAEAQRRQQMTAEDRIREALNAFKDDGRHEHSTSTGANPLGTEAGITGRQRSTPLAMRTSQCRIRSSDQEFFGAVRNTNPVPTDDPRWRLASSSAGIASSLHQRRSNSGTNGDSSPAAWIQVGAVMSGSPAYRTRSAELDAISASLEVNALPPLHSFAPGRRTPSLNLANGTDAHAAVEDDDAPALRRRAAQQHLEPIVADHPQVAFLGLPSAAEEDEDAEGVETPFADSHPPTATAGRRNVVEANHAPSPRFSLSP